MRFISRKHRNLRIVLDPRIRVKDFGRTITQSLTQQTKLGLTVEFKDNLFETNDKVTIEALKNHPEYGFAFISDEVGVKVEPTVEAIAAHNEKKAVAEEARSTCDICGAKFKNDFALNGHMKTHK